MPATATPRGGNYRAAKARDGTWSVLDVPIFADCERQFTAADGKPVTLKVDRLWQERAVGVAQGKYANARYEHPLFADTHERGKRRRIGTFLPKSVVRMGVGLEQKDATLCDYHGLSDADYADFKAGRYPYASAEFLFARGRTPEIQGVALVTERPYHEFPLQGVGSEVSDPACAEGVLAFHAEDEKGSVLVRFSMPDDPNAKPAAPVAPANAAAPANPADPAKPEGVEGAIATLTAKFDAMATSITAALAKLLGGALGGDPVKPAPVAGAAFDADGKPVEPPAVPATFAAEMTTLKGENAALKTRLDARDKAEARRVAVTGAVESLRGYDVGGSVLTLCEAKFDAGGKVALDAFVEGRTAAGDREPDAAWATGDHKGDVDPLVAKFGAENSDMVAVLAQEYEGVHESIKRGGLSREAHVRSGLVRAGRITVAAAYGPAAK